MVWTLLVQHRYGNGINLAIYRAEAASAPNNGFTSFVNFQENLQQKLLIKCIILCRARWVHVVIKIIERKFQITFPSQRRLAEAESIQKMEGKADSSVKLFFSFNSLMNKLNIISRKPPHD